MAKKRSLITRFKKRKPLRPILVPSILYRKTGLPLTIYGLRHRARQHLTTLSQRELASCLNSIAENTQQIFEDKLSWQVPVPSRMHLEWASSVLSAYQVMSDFCGDSNQGLAIIDDATHFAAAPRQPRRIARQFERAICNTPTMLQPTPRL